MLRMPLFTLSALGLYACASSPHAVMPQSLLVQTFGSTPVLNSSVKIECQAPVTGGSVGDVPPVSPVPPPPFVGGGCGVGGVGGVGACRSSTIVNCADSVPPAVPAAALMANPVAETLCVPVARFAS